MLLISMPFTIGIIALLKQKPTNTKWFQSRSALWSTKQRKRSSI